MDIGEEAAPIEVPVPLLPGRIPAPQPQPAPLPDPVKEPAR